jgi:hypothetical protein
MALKLITVYKDETTNFIFFENSTAQPAPASVLGIENLDATDPGRIKIFRTDKTDSEGNYRTIFKRMNYLRIVDIDGNGFNTVDETVTFLNNLISTAPVTSISAQYKGIWDADNNSPDILTTTGHTTGDWYFVTTNGTVDLGNGNVEVKANSTVRFDGTNWSLIPYAGSMIEFNSNQILVNTNPSVYADESPGKRDPLDLEDGWYFKNENVGEKINWYFVGNTNTNYEMTIDTLKNSWALVNLKEEGELFFSVYTTPKLDGADSSWYRSKLNYADNSQFIGRAGQTILIYFGTDPNIYPNVPHVQLQLDNGTTVLSSSHDVNDSIYTVSLGSDSSSSVGNTEFIVKNLGYKNNEYTTNYQLVSKLDSNEIKTDIQTILDSSLNSEYDIYLDASYTGSVSNGSTLQPYKTFEEAVNNSSPLDSILILGSNIIPSGGITLPHPINIFGAGTTAELKFANYDVNNGDLIKYIGTGTETLKFMNIKISNSGGYGLYIKDCELVKIEQSRFFNNGWDGTQLNTILPSTVTGLMGFDSTSTDLQAFYASSNASNGGAMRIENVTSVEIKSNMVKNNLRGIRLEDCGVGGYGFITRNVSTQNIESGIYLAAGSTHYGCQNVVVSMNSSAYNANNGLLAIGGINNKFSQNEVNGNWNAGMCGWGTANLTLRDCGLYDNNRSTYNGIGNTGDAKASIQINDAYNLLGTSITYNPAFRFIAEILGTQVHYTGLGSNTDKVGVLVTSAVGSIPYNPKNIIKVDDVGFIGQDIAIDFSEVDSTNLKLVLGDNSFINISEENVKEPITGGYAELPYSNHVTSVKELDIVVDTLKRFISLHEGVGGKVINTYKVNELNSVETVRGIDIYQSGTNKVQLWDNTLGNVYINGVQAGANISTMNNSVNAAFSMNLVQYKDFIESEVGVIGDDPATFFYIESPDGVFDYPLFKTEAEANAFDLANGGTGTSHTHDYDDDLTNTTWYMPTSLGVMDASSAPLNGVYGNSTNVIWNIQTTDDDANYAATFNSITYNVQEGSSVNIPYKPAGDTATYNITNVPNGYADDGYNITGTAEDITNGAGNSIQHVINVTKVPSGEFASVQGTITINVKADLDGNEFTLVDQGGVIKFTQNGGLTILDFNTVTFNAGSTYKFFLDGSTMQTNDVVDLVNADGSSITGNDGVTQSGGSGPGYAGSYFQYVIPSDVAPGKFITFTDGATSTAYANVPLTIAGSTYTANPTGITLEGPSVNQTGSNVMDQYDHGWISLNETLAAGERLVLDNAFFTDFFGEVQGTNNLFAIGLKGDNWVNTREVNSNGAAASGGSAGSETFKGNLYIVGIWSGGASNLTMWVGANNQLGNSMYMNTSSLWNTACGFLEVTGSGDNIRAGIGRNGNAGVSQGDESTTTYDNWNSYKGQTGEQGYGITNLDVVMSFWTYNGGDIDGDQIDWTGLTEVSVPVASTNDTSWTKALDFSGSSQYAKQVSNSMYTQPLQMSGLANTITGNSTAGYTSDHINARPWATAIVFKADRHNSAQIIWNQGEGTSSGSDNISLVLVGNGDLSFEWARQGTGVNKCRIATNISSSTWYGVYIAHSGERLGGNNASASNLADCFDIRIMSSADSFNAVGNNLSTSSNWITTGLRMDRTVAGDFTVGARGGGFTYYGKVASMLVTTLIRNQAMPDATEIELMITDPTKWVDDYKVGKDYRGTMNNGTTGNFQKDHFLAYRSTMVWLMGDSNNDSYSNGMRNDLYSIDQNWTKMQLINMQPTDIVNISGIPGL